MAEYENFPAEWKYKDTLREMTTKFNLAVKAIVELQEKAEGINEETLSSLTTVQQQINDEIEQLKEDIQNKADTVTVADLNLDKVDNTADIDKPVSTATRQAIDEAVEDMLTSEEAGAEFSSKNLYDPEVSTPVKQYIEDRLTELFIAYNNGTYTPEYNIASDNRLGVIKSSTKVQVNQSTGEIEIPTLDDAENNISELQSKVSAITKSLESNNSVTTKVEQDLGNITGLATETKTSIVAAINELVRKVQDLDS